MDTKPSPTFQSSTSVAGSPRRVAIAVDLSDESAYAVGWAVHNYLRPGDDVILLHVRPTNVLYGADWGSIKLQINGGSASPQDEASFDEENHQRLEDVFETFTNTKTNTLAEPLVEAKIPFKIHIVRDHDMKERLCLEVERLGLSAVIMGSRGFGACRKKGQLGRLGSVSDYCVRHCVCPVVVIRYPGKKGCDDSDQKRDAPILAQEAELHPVPEEEQEYHDDE